MHWLRDRHGALKKQKQKNKSDWKRAGLDKCADELHRALTLITGECTRKEIGRI